MNVLMIFACFFSVLHAETTKTEYVGISVAFVLGCLSGIHDVFVEAVSFVQSARETVAVRFQPSAVQVASPQTHSLQSPMRSDPEKHAGAPPVPASYRFFVDGRLFQLRNADSMPGRVHHRRQPAADERSVLQCVRVHEVKFA